MSFLTSWLLSVIGTAFLVSVAEALMPDEKVRQVGHLVGGLLMMLVLLTPLLQLRPGDWSVSVEDYFSQVEDREALYRQNQEETLSALIKGQTETYIEAAAQDLGLSARARVSIAQTEAGVPWPEGVTLNIPYHAALSDLIEKDLGIAQGDQQWSTKETG